MKILKNPVYMQYISFIPILMAVISFFFLGFFNIFTPERFSDSSKAIWISVNLLLITIGCISTQLFCRCPSCGKRGGFERRPRGWKAYPG